MDQATYRILTTKHLKNVALPSKAAEMTVSLSKTLKTNCMLYFKPFEYASNCIMNFLDGQLTFEVSILDALATKIDITHRFQGSLVSFDQTDSKVHLLTKHINSLYAYQRLEMNVNTYGGTTIEIDKTLDVTICEESSTDLQFQNIICTKGLVVFWGKSCLATYCTRTQEQILFPYTHLKIACQPTIQVKISDQLVFFLPAIECSKVYVLNKDLKSTLEGGIIFCLDTNTQVQTFFVLDKIKLKQQIPTTQVEDFKIEKRLKPQGLILTVSKSELMVWNFDEALEKKKNTCRLESSIQMQESIINTAVSSDQDLIVCLHGDLTIASYLLKGGEIIQINRFTASLTKPPSGFEVFTKAKGQKKTLEVVIYNSLQVKVFIGTMQPMHELSNQLQQMKEDSLVAEVQFLDQDSPEDFDSVSTEEKPEDVAVNQLDLSDMSDKYVQKFCKHSQQHLSLATQALDVLDKTCQAVKPLNKLLRQQANQFTARCTNPIKSPQLWTSLKSQSMMSSKQISKLLPTDCFGQLLKEIDDIDQGSQTTEQVCQESFKQLFSHELSQLVKISISQSIQEFVIEPYQNQIDDYLEKQTVESEILDERLSLIQAQF